MLLLHHAASPLIVESRGPRDWLTRPFFAVPFERMWKTEPPFVTLRRDPAESRLPPTVDHISTLAPHLTVRRGLRGEADERASGSGLNRACMFVKRQLAKGPSHSRPHARSYMFGFRLTSPQLASPRWESERAQDVLSTWSLERAGSSISFTGYVIGRLLSSS